MLLSLGLIILLGLFLGTILNKLHLPSLLGFLITGIILGPDVANLIHADLLNISTSLREVALIIILTRAGLSLNLNNLKQNGRPAILLSFVPACFEILGITLLTHFLAGISITDGLIIGSVIAAVSPAVLVPRMIKLKNEGYDKVAETLMASSSIDDIIVIILFTSFTSLSLSGSFNITNLLEIPLSIISGAIVGLLIGYLLNFFFKKVHLRDSIKVTIFIAIYFILVSLEDLSIPYSGLLSIMFSGIILNYKYPVLAKRLELKFSKLWVLAEILLFVLVGCLVDLASLKTASLLTILILLGGLIFRMIGVRISLLKTKFKKNERLFMSLAFIPKATVQAALGSIPLSMGLAIGNTCLTYAVLAILITASLGAILIDNTYKKLL